MKKTIIILLFTFCWACGYSVSLSAGLSVSIPTNDTILKKKKIRICDSLLGKIVGEGSCSDFAFYVFEKVYGYHEDVIMKAPFKNKHLIAYLQVGDLILIKKARLIKEGDVMMVIEKHLAIIYDIIDDCRIALIHQSLGESVHIENYNFCKIKYRDRIMVILPD